MYENGFVSWKSCLCLSLPPFAVPCGRTGHRSTWAFGLKSLCAARGSCLITQKDIMHLYWELHKTNIFVQQELKSEPSLGSKWAMWFHCRTMRAHLLLYSFIKVQVYINPPFFPYMIIYIYRKGEKLFWLVSSHCWTLQRKLDSFFLSLLSATNGG